MGYFGGKGLPFFAWTVPGAETPDKPLAGSAYVWHKRAGESARAAHMLVRRACAHVFVRACVRVFRVCVCSVYNC